MAPTEKEYAEAQQKLAELGLNQFSDTLWGREDCSQHKYHGIQLKLGTPRPWCVFGYSHHKSFKNFDRALAALSEKLDSK